jgi:UDP-N-acetylglucosamine diphosphorylase/glucosamine-1-phosphate N-acetyltransferase
LFKVPKMQVVLFEDENWRRFLPLAFTRPVGDLRVGIFKISEKWEKVLNARVAHRTRTYLRPVFNSSHEKDVLLINARLLPNERLVSQLNELRNGEALVSKGRLLAMRSNPDSDLAFETSREFDGEYTFLNSCTDLFTYAGQEIQADLPLWLKDKKLKSIDASNTVIGDASQIYISESATVVASILNTTNGPIILDDHSEVMEGSLVRGGLYLGEHSVLKMGTKMYGPTTIGPHCKMGGEITNSVVYGYSNKSHEGYLGNSVLGEWCNLGADTNNSNLKNNYSEVQTWNYEENKYTDTGLTFCGLIMGDHSKAGINTMFNTGTVVGVAANIFGGGFPPKHIPSFSWGGADGFVEHELDKALETASKMMDRRNLPLTEAQQSILKQLFNDK